MSASRSTLEARQLRTLARLALVAAALAPGRLVDDGPVLCAFRRVTGLPCPTCGMTRSWHAATRLRLRTSAAHHPLGPVTFGIAALVALDGTGAARVLRLPGPAMAVSLVWLAVWLGRCRTAVAAGRATTG